MPAHSPGNPFDDALRSLIGRRAAAALLTVAALVSPAPARAASSSEPAQPAAETGAQGDKETKAMEAYRRGEAAYSEKQYEEALAAFQEASSFFASPDFQYNIGRCYENLERYEDAVRSYEIYLRADPSAADSGDVRERIGRLRGLLEARKAEPDPSEPDPPAAQTPADPIRDKPRPPGRVFVISGSVLLGVGAALAIGGGVGFGVVASSRSDELDDIQAGGNPDNATFGDAQTVEDEGKQAEVGQIATAAAGGAIAIAGVALLAVGLLKNKNARAGGTTRVVPSLNRRAAGLVLTGRF